MLTPRRRLVPLLCALLALAVAAALSACGSDDGGGSGGDSARAAGGAEAGAFPVTVAHRYGATTVKAEPKRVVTVGLREQDALLALGVTPVAVTKWLDDTPGAIYPWAKRALGSAALPVVLNQDGGIQIEKVAAQRPDLIIAIYSGLTKKEYATLSKIAPVIAQPKGEVDYGSSWQEETLMSGRAVGRPAAAQGLVDRTAALIAKTAAAHPEFKGLTAANVSDYQGVYVYGPQDVRTRLLTELGFAFPPGLAAATKGDFGGQLSEEKTDLLDVGALLWFAQPAGIKKIKRHPVYSKLKVRTEGRDVFIKESDRVYNATSFVSVLSVPTLMRELVPRLAAAADGDPATSTDQAAAG